MMTIRSSGIVSRAAVVAAALSLCACSVSTDPHASPEVSITSAPAAVEPPPPPAPAPTPPLPVAKPTVREQDFSEAIRAFYGCLGRAADQFDISAADPREAGKALIDACSEERAKSIAVWSKGRPARIQAEYARQRDPDDLEVATNLILNRRAKAGK